MPEGAHARYEAHEALDFPVGTIISKTFFYPLANGKDAVARTDETAHDRAGECLDLRNVRMIETSLLVRREAGWVAITYVGNKAQTAAALERPGAEDPPPPAAPHSGCEDCVHI